MGIYFSLICNNERLCTIQMTNSRVSPIIPQLHILIAALRIFSCWLNVLKVWC